jgi:chromosome partitioning protein
LVIYLDAMPTIIAISNQKGGVAKTTTSISLGAALVEAGQEVLLVDLDPQANLTLGMGILPENLIYSIANVMMGNLTIARVSRETGIQGLDVLPANRQMRMVERFLTVRPSYENVLHEALLHSNLYDLCLVDCPPSMGPLTLNGLAAADLVLIPIQCEPFALHSLNETLQYMVEQRGRLGLPVDCCRILPTLFDRRNRIHQETLVKLREKYGSMVLESVIQVDTRLRQSQAASMPITRFAPHSRSAQQYKALARELLRLLKTGKFIQQPA